MGAKPESLLATRKRLQRERKARPGDPALLLQLAGVLEQLDAWPDLGRLLDAAVRRWPRNTELLMTRARMRGYLGDFEAARDDYLAVMALTPGHPEALCALVLQGHAVEAGGLDAVEAGLAAPDTPVNSRNRLHYARARLLEQQGHVAPAFEVYREANERRAAAGGMDLQAKLRGAHSVIADLGGEHIERFSGRGHPSNRPVFIVGMPRSGTSLAEQVLGAHPGVYAAGERLFWGQALRGLLLSARDRQVHLLEAIDRSGPQAWRRAGASYLAAIGEIDHRASRITDKLPANFALLPYVRLVFPKARIIHLRRHALDTITSCLRTPFSDPALAFTLEDWARFHGMYQGLMDCWRPVLGEQMLEMNYEDMVSDLPRQARRMTDFLGLEWNEACLHPERNRNAVRTASVEQVRRRVHTSSIGAWQRFGAPLEALLPLIDSTREELRLSACNEKGRGMLS